MSDQEELFLIRTHGRRLQYPKGMGFQKTLNKLGTMFATRNKCIASSNRCLTSSKKKLVETSALLLGARSY